MSAARNVMKRYTYRGIAALGVFWYQMAGVVAICFFTLATVGAMIIAISVDPPAWSIFCFAVLGLAFAWPMGLSMICTYPSSVSLDAKGLLISVLWRKHIAIPWSDILEVRRQTFGGHYLVIARRITVWHRLVGWTHAYTHHPAFLIRQGLENCEELVREIKLRIGQLD